MPDALFLLKHQLENNLEKYEQIAEKVKIFIA